MKSVELRIAKMLDCEAITEWEREFAKSLLQRIESKGFLTPRQEAYLQKMENKYSAENIQAVAAWKENFTAEMREDMKIVANYYINNPPYFGDLARNILNDENFVPTERQYISMMDNKYAMKVLELAKSEPLFPDGSFALIRVGKSFPGFPRNEKNRMVLIIQHSKIIKKAAKDARPVMVLPVGSTKPFWVEERDLKPTSRKKKDKK